MKDEFKTKKQQIDELKELRQQTTEVETNYEHTKVELSRYKMIVNTTNVIILVHDDNWRLTIMNPYGCRMLG